jgi:DNA-binding NtrC family response regulator
MSARVLIIEDDQGYAAALSRHLHGAGHEVIQLHDAASARAQTSLIRPDVVVIDQQLPDAMGLSLLEDLKPLLKAAVFVVMTAHPALEFAVEAMRRGAFDYFEKGQDPRETMLRIERAVAHAELRRRVIEAQVEQGLKARATLIGVSPAMERLRARLDALAVSDDTTALITGEPGVGKSLVAHAIHLASRRATEPFVAVDCTGSHGAPLESELFGHEADAAGAAHAVQLGRVEMAQRGTLFLDEIGELELSLQEKLLRLVEQREFTRVGSGLTRQLSARIITATHRDLARAVEAGRFRAELRFRLEVFVLEVPALRERGDDVFLIAEHYLAARARVLGRQPPVLDAEVRQLLRKYPFPGNVRELKNMVEQALLLSDADELSLDEFPVLARFDGGWQPSNSAARLGPRPSAVSPPSGFPGAPRLASAALPHAAGAASLGVIRERYLENERTRLVDALESSGGNVSHAARNLGLSRYQLLRRLTKHGLR